MQHTHCWLDGAMQGGMKGSVRTDDDFFWRFQTLDSCRKNRRYASMPVTGMRPMPKEMRQTKSRLR